MSNTYNRSKSTNTSQPSASALIARFNTKNQQTLSQINRSNPNSRKDSQNNKLSTDKSDASNADPEYTNDIQDNKNLKKFRKPPPPSSKPATKHKPKASNKNTNEPSLLRQQQPKPKIFTFIEEKEEDKDTYIATNNSNDEYKPLQLPKSLNNEQTSLTDLNNMILLYQQAVDDVHQAIVDVKETSKDITNKVKSVTEQLHIIIDTREDTLLDEITKKTASKIFALDTQFTKLQQRLMFCREARNEAQQLLNKHNKSDNNKNKKSRCRTGSSGSAVNYHARKDRIMAIVNKTKLDAKNEFESELNRGEPIVNTRFHVQHYDITKQLETLGNIIDDVPLREYQLFPPQIINTRVSKKSLRVNIRSREKIEDGYDELYGVLACQFEPQLVFVEEQKELNNPEQLTWKSLGWIELNPTPIKTDRNDGKKNMVNNEYSKLITGLTDFIDSENDGKYIYIRTRVRKLIKLEESGVVDEDDDENDPIWIESHFSTPVRLFLRAATQMHIDKAAPLPSLSDLSMSPTDEYTNDTINNYNAFEDEQEKKRRKKNRKKPKKKRRGASTENKLMSTPLSPNSLPKNSLHFVDEDEEEIKFYNIDEDVNGTTPIKTSLFHHESNRSGSLYEVDSEFTKQRRHSNYHIQDELYSPGVLLLDKAKITWHDVVNNKNIIVSDKIPVSERTSCGMCVAHDVLVADDDDDDDDEQEDVGVPNDNDEEAGSRYTSIMFRVGGTLNKKADRSVDMVDLTTGMWSSLPSMKHSRSLCQPVLLNGNIVCAGGCGKKTKPLSSVELFDFELSEWRQLKSLQQHRWGHAVYVMYYEDNEKIAKTPSMTNTPTLNTNVESAKIIVAGGWSKKKKNIRTAEIYDTETNKWDYIAPMNVPRSRCVAMEWTSIDRVGVIGGWGDSTKIVEYYDCNKNEWFRLNDLNHEHIYPSCGLMTDQHLYAMNRFIENDAKNIIQKRKHEHQRQMQSHKISLFRGRPQPFVLGSNDQLTCLELFDDRMNKWIILQTFAHSQNNIISMIECALPKNVTTTLTQRDRGYSTSVRSESEFGPSSWQRRGSKILGML